MTYGWHMKIRFTYFDQHCVWTMSWFKMLYDCVRLTTGYLGRAKLVILRIQAFIFWGKIDGVNDATLKQQSHMLCQWIVFLVRVMILRCLDCHPGSAQLRLQRCCLRGWMPATWFWFLGDSVTFARQKWFNSPRLHMKKLRNQATMLRKVTERKRTILPALLRRET